MQRLRHPLLECWLLCMLLLALCPVYAMPVIDVPAANGSNQMLRAFEYLEDPGHTISIDDIRRMPSARFADLRDAILNRHVTSSDFWLRTTVRNTGSTTRTWVMQHGMPTTDYVDYWIFRDGKPVTHAVGGDRTLLSERQIDYRTALVKYTSLPGETVELYIRVRNIQRAVVFLVFGISSEERFMTQMAQDQLVLGALYGIPLALAISALSGWVVAGIRSGQVPIYVMYVLSVLGSWMGVNGQLGQYVFVDQPALANAMLHVFFLLVSASMAMFARGFLRTKVLMPKFDLYFKGIMLVALTGIVLRMTVAGAGAFVLQLASVLMLCSLATPLAAWIALKKGIVYARWYLVAQLMYSAAFAIGVVGIGLEKLYYDYFIYCELAFFGELLLLGVAQQDRLRVLKNERVLVERQYKTALEESNAELEREVYERTRNLQEAYKRTQFLTEVKTATRRIADGEFTVRLQEGDSVDMRDLASSVNSMAESLSRLEGARRRWIAEISHELRTPLFALMCETEALLDGVRTLNKRAIESLHEEILRLSLLVSDLHELALSYLRPLPCTFTAWRLDDVAHKLEKRYGEQARAKDLVFELKMLHGERIVTWDKGRIEQLLGNLVQNSISYTDAPGKIAMTLAVNDEHACIDIQDSPPGVSAEEAHHLFEPLFRADAARSRRSGGSGLGLSICQAIVHAHNGHMIATRSALGGLAIRIDLPLAIEENER